VVICCFTIHLVLPYLLPPLRQRVLSLVDVCVTEVKRRQERQLLLGTLATRRLRLLEQHPQWNEISELIIYPDEADQEFIHHDILYRLKKNGVESCAMKLKLLLQKYEVQSFLAVCTELHLLAPFFLGGPESFRGYACIDALTVLAREIASGLHDQPAICPLPSRSIAKHCRARL
jgi:aspartate racemase